MEYPADITKLAANAAHDIFGSHAEDWLREFLSELILTERKRCAKVAIDCPTVKLDKTDATDHRLTFSIGAGAQARAIAAAIMRGNAE